MSPLVQSMILWVVFTASWAAVAVSNLSRMPSRPPVRFTWWAGALWAVVAIPSTLQFTEPRLLTLCERDSELLFHGQWWRLVTGNLVQDGGVAGTISNLATLAVTVLIVARAIPGPLMVALFAVGGVGSMLLQVAHPGAGNSMATLALVAATAVIAPARHAPKASVVGVTLVAGVGMLLTFWGDEHGPSILLGLALGALCRWTLPRAWRTAGRPERVTNVIS